mgnify:CR=1 FL=1
MRRSIRVAVIVFVAGLVFGVSQTSAATAPGLLAKLKTGNERPTGYDRGKFNHWTTLPGKGCDTRDWVLFRQSAVQQRRCGAESGRWFSLYDGRTLTRAAKLDVDHMVPLAEAWGSGAKAWTPRQRETYANDLYPFSLVAVSLSSNRSKGDSDPSEWLPPRKSFICSYLARWTAVKYRWRLTVDARERRVIQRRFEDCPQSSLRLPTIVRARVPAGQGGGGGGGTDPRFDTCTEAIDAGYGPYTKAVDPEYWWYEDRDGDGTVCEA